MAREQYHGRIFVVDDNEMNVDLLCEVLGRYGFDTFSALGALEALDKVHEIMPEMIMLDINMPQMSGYEVCERLKADEAVADIPVIFISALNDLKDVVKGFDVGGVDYITKPFKAKEVIARVQSQLQVYRAKKQIEALRERDRQQFEMIDKMRQRFIGSATHDLKNPLFIVSGYVDMLAMNEAVQEDPMSQEFIAAIKRGVDKMQTLVFDMLDLLHMEKVGQIQPESVEVGDFVRASLQDMRLRADEKNIAFVISLPTEAVYLSLDKAKMARVLDNLVSNAIKYTPENGMVEVLVTAQSDDVAIAIIDNGLGIPEEMLPNLFQPFERVNTQEHMAQEGTGLGLSIAKSIVEQHGGAITVTSELGSGSTFKVMLPLSQS